MSVQKLLMVVVVGGGGGGEAPRPTSAFYSVKLCSNQEFITRRKHTSQTHVVTVIVVFCLCLVTNIESTCQSSAKMLNRRNKGNFCIFVLLTKCSMGHFVYRRLLISYKQVNSCVVGEWQPDLSLNNGLNKTVA